MERDTRVGRRCDTWAGVFLGLFSSGRAMADGGESGEEDES